MSGSRRDPVRHPARSGASATGVSPRFGPADRDMHVGERLGAGVGEHQPRRRRGLGRRQALGQLQPVDRDLARPGRERASRAGAAVAAADRRPVAMPSQLAAKASRSRAQLAMSAFSPDPPSRPSAPQARDRERPPVRARRGVAIGIAPGIVGQPPDIVAGDQRLQPFLAGRIALVVEPVHLDALLERRDVGPRLGRRRAVGGRHDVDDDDGGEQADDDDHDHQLDQGEALLACPRSPAKAGVSSGEFRAFASCDPGLRRDDAGIVINILRPEYRAAGSGAGSKARSARPSRP